MHDRSMKGPVRLVAVLLALGLGGGAQAQSQDMRVITFGAADLNGNYFAVAKAVCARINALPDKGLRCSPEATPGSVYNLQAMERGELDFALVQSDWQLAAVSGTGAFDQAGPQTGLRSVLSLYPEALTLTARRDAGIRSLDDLVGKVVDIGHPSAARRGTAERLLEALAIPEGAVDFRELQGPALDEALCTGAIDAAITVFGHPNPRFGRTIEDCDLVLVPVAGRKVDAFLERNPDFSRHTIPAGTYPGVTRPVPTFSVAATLVARHDIPDEVVRLFLGTLIDDYDGLRELVPVLPAGNPLDWRTRGLSAPLHPGAAAVFDALEE